MTSHQAAKPRGRPGTVTLHDLSWCHIVVFVVPAVILIPGPGTDSVFRSAPLRERTCRFLASNQVPKTDAFVESRVGSWVFSRFRGGDSYLAANVS